MAPLISYFSSSHKSIDFAAIDHWLSLYFGWQSSRPYLCRPEKFNV
jgi:hypothetical protein